MIFPRFAICLVLLTLAAFGGGAGAVEPVAISRLEPGDSLRIEFERSGCFNASSCVLIVERRADGRVTVRGTDTSARREPESGRLFPASVALAERTLGANEVARLDAGFAYCRVARPGCTTIDALTLTHWRKGRPLVMEHLEDASCVLGEDDGRMSIPDLVATMETRKTGLPLLGWFLGWVE